MKDLSLHILDIIQNSVRAQASNVILEIREDLEKDIYSIFIKDDGCGMSEEVLTKVLDPFFTTRTTRKVGLGLSLLKQRAEQTGGNLEIHSKKGVGTELKVQFCHGNIDRPVIGDIAGVMVLLVSANPNMDFVYRHYTTKGEYIFDTKEIKNVLEEILLTDPNIIPYLKELINENLNTII